MYHKRLREKQGLFGGWKLLGVAVVCGLGAAAIPGSMALAAWDVLALRVTLGVLAAITLFLMPVYLMLTSFRPWR